MVQYAMLLTSLGDYRFRTMKLVKDTMAGDLAIAAGIVPPEPSIRVLTRKDIEMHEVANYFVGPFVIQLPPVPVLLARDTLALDLNPRALHVWLILMLRKALGRRTIVWGHAFPRQGKAARSDKIRGLLRKFADGVLTYTDTQKHELQEMHPGKPIYSAPNSLYHRSEIGFDADSVRTDILFVGRLIASKKADFLLSAFVAAAAHLPPQVRLVFVGDGPEMPALKNAAAAAGLAERVVFAGYNSRYEDLRALYKTAFVAVSPGYVGLSITQSFAFGVPMIISRDENHSPEIEAAVEGRNAVFFETGSTTALAEGLTAIWQDRHAWGARGPDIAEDCRSRYSVETMAAGIMAALTGR